MSHSPHPSLDTLAALADGRLHGLSAQDTRRHLTQCARCLDAFTAAAEANLRDWEERSPRDPALVALGRSVAQPPARGHRRVGHLPWRPRVAWGAACGSALAVLATVLLWPAERSMPDRSQVAGVTVAPLHAAVQDMSAFLEGALVLPGGEAFADAKPGPAQRSGGDVASLQIRDTLARLEDLEAKGGLFSPQLAYWLGVAYLAVGDLTTARIHLDQSLRRFPDEVELLLLDAVYANRNNELPLAEQRLRQALAVAPRHRLAQLDLGILLARDPPRREQASSLLAEVADASEGPLAARARRVLSELPTQ